MNQNAVCAPAAGSRTRKKALHTEMRTREALTGYLFISVNLIGTLIFRCAAAVYDCCAQLFGMGLHQRSGRNGICRLGTLCPYGERPGKSALPCGTILFSLPAIPVTIVLALLLASLLNKLAFCKKFHCEQYILFHLITSWVSVSIVFKALFNPEGGPVNKPLMAAGNLGILPDGSMDIHWSMTSIVILTVWHTVGYYMVILLAGLQNINTELYEAAAIDGANARQRYFRITLPMLTPSLFFIMIMSMINSLKVFDQVSVATQGGPGTSSSFWSMPFTITPSTDFEMGYASAIAWVLFIIILIFTLVQVETPKTNGSTMICKGGLEMDAKKNRHFERILGKTVVTVVLIICGISCLLPLAWMISTSFKPELDVFEYPIR